MRLLALICEPILVARKQGASCESLLLEKGVPSWYSRLTAGSYCRHGIRMARLYVDTMRAFAGRVDLGLAFVARWGRSVFLGWWRQTQFEWPKNSSPNPPRFPAHPKPSGRSTRSNRKDSPELKGEPFFEHDCWSSKSEDSVLSSISSLRWTRCVFNLKFKWLSLRLLHCWATRIHVKVSGQVERNSNKGKCCEPKGLNGDKLRTYAKPVTRRPDCVLAAGQPKLAPAPLKPDTNWYRLMRCGATIL